MGEKKRALVLFPILFKIVRICRMELLYEYFASGIVESGIRQFGGDDCHAEIPALYHFCISVFFGGLSVFLCWLWRDHLVKTPSERKRMRANWAEELCFWAGLGSLLLTLWCKVATRRGLFILNPCHVTLAVLLALLRADNTSVAMRRVHVAWTAWLFCPFAALLFPHLEEIGVLELLLYYVEHLIILPLGPLFLFRRYGNPWPSFKSHIAGFASMIAFQTLVLVPIGRFLKVNLNFALCHSPDEPFYPIFGYHYFVAQIFNLCIIAFLVHLLTSCLVWAFFKAVRREGEAVKAE